MALLLYRGERHKYERLKDYANRISSRNGFSSAKAFKSYLKVHFPESKPTDKPKFNSDDGGYSIFCTYFYRGQIPAHFYRLASSLKRNVELLDIDKLSKEIKENNLKICPTCYAKNRIIFFYWYLEDYLACHLCAENMVFFSAFRSSRDIASPINRVSENWMSVVVREALDVDRPLTYVEYKVGLKNEIIWFYRSLVRFFDRYDLSISYSPIRLLKVIESSCFWLLSTSEKYEFILCEISSGRDISKYELRFIAAALLSGKRGAAYDSYCLGLKGEGIYNIQSESRCWAGTVFLEYDLSRLVDAKFKFERWYKWSVCDYIDGFTWLGDEDDRIIRRILSNFTSLRTMWQSQLVSG